MKEQEVQQEVKKPERKRKYLVPEDIFNKKDLAKRNDKELKKFLKNFKLVGFGDNIKKYIIPKSLNHFYTIIEERKKLSFLITLVKNLEDEKLIVFVSTAD